MKSETEGTGGRSLTSDWPLGVSEDPRSHFDRLVPAIVVAAARILPTYFRARGGAVLWRACAAPLDPTR